MSDQLRDRLQALLDEYRGVHKGGREMADWLTSRGVTLAADAPGEPSKCPLCDIRIVPVHKGITLQCSYCNGSWQEPL